MSNFLDARTFKPGFLGDGKVEIPTDWVGWLNGWLVGCLIG